MHRKKSKKIIFYFFLLISVSSITNISLNKSQFYKIQNIYVSGLDEKNNEILLEHIRNLNLGNIFFLNRKEINELINTNNLIEKYKITKNYPSTITIEIKKTDFLANINIQGKNFLIGTNGKLIFDENKYKHLPYIFGQPNIEEFLKFKNIIDDSKFSYSEIKNLYFFPSKRWDIQLKNNTLLKLSKNFSKETLDNIYIFLKDYNLENTFIVDTRINNQIIIND